MTRPRRSLFDTTLARRDFLLRAGAAALSIPLVNSLACGPVATESGDARDPANTDAGSNDDLTWATGSGAFLADKSYRDPFASGIGSTCNVYESSSKGPCHSNTFDRQDLTEGQVGLPTRLQLLVVDKSCAPVPNAKVEIWHCSIGGLYSGAPVNGSVGGDLNTRMCTEDDDEALEAGWFRGARTAGADGIVTFDTLFPGWYASRAWHIHFQVSVGATQYVVSQLFADEALKDDIYGSHASYSSRPTSMNGYVRNSADKVVQESGLALADVVLETEQQSDGALLAWKALTVNR